MASAKASLLMRLLQYSRHTHLTFVTSHYAFRACSSTNSVAKRLVNPVGHSRFLLLCWLCVFRLRNGTPLEEKPRLRAGLL